MDILFQIVTMFIPKAGLQISGIPLTFSLVLLLFVIIRNPNQTLLAIQSIKGMGVLYAILFLFGAMSLLFGLTTLEPFSIAQILTVVGSPLAIVATTRIKTNRLFKITCVALIVVNIYALIQFSFSVVRTSIPGLTYTYGQDLSEKPIGFHASGEATKIPSTYQNGAYLGIFCVLGLTLMLVWKVGQKWRITRICSIILSVIGIAICGSRSIILPFLVICVFLVLQRIQYWPPRMRGTYLLGLGFLVSIVAGYLFIYRQDIIQAFISRNVGQTVSDPTASGRTTQWSDSWLILKQLPALSFIRILLFGGGSAFGIGGEGLPKFVFEMGLPAALAFYGMLIVAALRFWKNKETQPLSLGIACVFAAFCIDQSFNYPPTVMELFFAIGMGISILKNSSDEQKEDSELLSRKRDALQVRAQIK